MTPARADGLGLRHARRWRIEKRLGDGPRAPVFEIIEGGEGLESRVVYRVPGIAAPESYTPDMEVTMFAIRIDCSVYDGHETHPPGETRLQAETAKRCVLRGVGALLDDKGGAMPLAEAARRLRITADDARAAGREPAEFGLEG